MAQQEQEQDGPVPTTPNRTGPGSVARISPLSLRTSATIRLRRLARDAVYKEELRQLVVPLPRGADAATVLRSLLADLVPAEVDVRRGKYSRDFREDAANEIVGFRLSRVERPAGVEEFGIGACA